MYVQKTSTASTIQKFNQRFMFTTISFSTGQTAGCQRQEIQEYFTITVVAAPDIKELFRDVALTDVEKSQVDRNETLGEMCVCVCGGGD